MGLKEGCTENLLILLYMSFQYVLILTYIAMRIVNCNSLSCPYGLTSIGKPNLTIPHITPNFSQPFFLEGGEQFD